MAVPPRAGVYTHDMNTIEVPPEPGQICAACRFWRADTRGEQTAGWGQCRRMPPTMPPIQDDKLVHVGLWPHTPESGWCGEWRAGP